MNHENLEVGDDYVGYKVRLIDVIVDQSTTDVGILVDQSSTILILTDELAAELARALDSAIGPRRPRAATPSHARWA
ncbi:hypothetical protein H7J06_10755 [Mycobacterium hodleri]|uniref:hypothetical protein n=1 Tax=Mycolicibacterium hodleri TaxID=49897 RepID=UPI0021F2CEE1|nr:hypothetical protein [Mycolicibacterium hodleri]MCV7133462.1 hypothetical protein [Mycolicibacterium hodleri]